MRKVHEDRLSDHTRITGFIRKNLAAWSEYPVLYQIASDYLEIKRQSDELNLELFNYKYKGSGIKEEARKNLERSVWYRIIPFLAEVAILQDDEQLLKETIVSQRSLEYISAEVFRERAQHFLNLATKYRPVCHSCAYTLKDEAEVKGQLDDFTASIDLPNREKSELGKKNRTRLHLLRKLNGLQGKLERLLLPLFRQDPWLEDSYYEIRRRPKTRSKRYAVVYQILDEQTGKPIAKANVEFPDIGKNYETSQGGRLWIKKFPKGHHVMKISHPNYQVLATSILLYTDTWGKSKKVWLQPIAEHTVPLKETDDRENNRTI